MILGLDNTFLGDILFKALVGPSPSIIGVIFVFRTYSKGQIKEYFRRIFSFKQMGWLCPLLLIMMYFGVCAITILFSTQLFGGQVPEFGGAKALVNTPYLIFMFIGLGLVSGPLNEEFGWRGFALDPLMKKYGFWSGSIILGFVWGIWHLPWYFYASNGQFIAWSINPIHGIAMILHSISLSCICSIAYIKRNRSILAGALAHFFSNFLVGGLLIYPFDNTYIIVSIYVFIFIETVVSLCFALSSRFKKEIKEKLHIDNNNVDTTEPSY